MKQNTSNVLQGIQYPVKEGKRLHYVKHPYDLSPTEWVAVRVSNKGGYLIADADRQNPTLHIFATEADCQKACDIHNDWVFNKYRNRKAIIAAILDLSFANG